MDFKGEPAKYILYRFSAHEKNSFVSLKMRIGITDKIATTTLSDAL